LRSLEISAFQTQTNASAFNCIVETFPPLLAPRSARSFGASFSTSDRPTGMSVVACNFAQCARKLYFITAGRIIESFFDDILLVICDGSLWAASARVGSHTGQTIGKFVEGKPALLFDIPELVNLTPLAASLGTAPGENITQKIRGCSDDVFTI
jgi:hypothetical protein